VKLLNFNYYWRLLVTPISWIIYGLGGIITSLTIFPIIYIAPIKKSLKTKISRYVVKFLFRSFIWIIKNIGFLTYEIQNIEKLYNRDSLLIFANHPTLLDIVFLISMTNLPNCVVKKDVWCNPVMFCMMRSLGYIKNSGDPEDVLSQCVDSLKQGDSLILFPEGTRTEPNETLVLKRGLAHIALRAKKNLTPISISCKPITLTKQHKWYNIPLEETPHYCITIRDDIKLGEFSHLNKSRPITARLLTKHLQLSLQTKEH